MKKIFLVSALLIFALHRVCSAGISPDGEPVGYESITVSSTAIGLTASKLAPTNVGLTPVIATITVEDDQVRFRLDGTAPTASEGQLLEEGDVLYLSTPQEMAGFKAIRVTTDAKLKVSYER